MSSNIAYVLGLFTLPIAGAALWGLIALTAWWRSPKRERIVRWRTWRIRRLEKKADRLARLWHTQEGDNHV